MDIGKRLKQLRVKNGLTLEELANRCELTKGFLSLVERDMTSPSISTLEDIVEALGITLEDFFTVKEHEKITFSKEDYFTKEYDDKELIWIVPNAQKNDMEPVYLRLKPEGTSELIKPHNGQEFGYIVQGRAVLEDLTNNIKYKLKKGETFYLRGEFIHQLRNNSNSDCEILWISTPPIF